MQFIQRAKRATKEARRDIARRDPSVAAASAFAGTLGFGTATDTLLVGVVAPGAVPGTADGIPVKESGIAAEAMTIFVSLVSKAVPKSEAKQYLSQKQDSTGS